MYCAGIIDFIYYKNFIQSTHKKANKTQTKQNKKTQTYQATKYKICLTSPHNMVSAFDRAR